MRVAVKGQTLDCIPTIHVLDDDECLECTGIPWEEYSGCEKYESFEAALDTHPGATTCDNVGCREFAHSIAARE